METLFLPFQFPFMQNAFLICLIIAPPTAIISTFLVLKGWALIGDAVSHAILPGVVIAYLLNIPLLIGAFVAGMLASLLTGYFAENSRVKQDTVMGVVFSTMFAIGIILMTAFPSDVHLNHILFGNMLGINGEDLRNTFFISLFVTLVFAVKWRDFLLYIFDPKQAKAAGLPVQLLYYGLLALLSLTVVSTLSSVGLILAIGLLISPGAIAFLLTKRFETMLLLSIVICMISMCLGIYLSFYLNSAPAPTIVLVMSVLFLVAFFRRRFMRVEA